MKTKHLLSVSLLCAALTSFCQWPSTELSEPRKAMGFATMGTKAYFAGGYNGNEYLTSVERYDVTTQTWDIAGNLSVPRYYIAGVTCGSRIFFAGGFDWNTSFATVDIYHTATGQWTVEQLSVDRFGMAAVSHGSKVLFAGGFQFPSITFKARVDIYDTLTGWSIAYLSEAREGIAAAVVGDLAIFAGGSSNNVWTTNRVDIYNFTTNTWDTTSISLARSYATATTVGDKVIIAGGVTSQGITTNRVDIYDASTGLWKIDSLSFPRSSSRSNAVTAKGKAYFVGGGVFIGSGFYWPSDVIDIYDPETGIWTVEYLNEPLLDHAVVSLEDYILVAGGENDLETIVPTVEIIDLGVGIAPGSEKKSRFTVYPNPGSGYLHLGFPGDNIQRPIQAMIYNMQGQVVFTQILDQANAKLQLNLPDGVYLLKVVSGENTYSEMIFIQK